jgi:hypothetical protein
MGFSSLVIGWHATEQHDSFECCVVPKLQDLDESVSSGDASVPEASPPAKTQQKRKRRGLISLFRGRARKEKEQPSPTDAPSDLQGKNTGVFMESLISVEYKEPIFEDGRDDYICEARNHGIGNGVECILPSIEYQKEDDALPFDVYTSLFIPGYQDKETFEVKTDQQEKEEDPGDPWSAAKKGDLVALMRYGHEGHNWKLEDAYQCTPLYYACHSGAALPKGIPALRFLLEQWPGHIPDDIFDRCKKNAINRDVVKLLQSTRGELCGVIVDTTPSSTLDTAGCTTHGDVLACDLFGDDGWGADFLFGENIRDDDSDSVITVSIASGYSLNADIKVGALELNAGSLTYSSSDSSDGSTSGSTPPIDDAGSNDQ